MAAGSKYTLVASDVFEATVAKNARDPKNDIMVQVSYHQSTPDQPTLRICKGWYTKDDTDFSDIQPSKQGFNISVDDIPEFKKMLTAVYAAARKELK